MTNATDQTSHRATDAGVDTGTEADPGHGHKHGYNGDKAKYLARLKRIEGQTRGIHRMIDEDQYCIDILTQISAVNSALENVALALLEDHVNHCVRAAVGEGGETLDDKLDEAMKAVKRMVKS